MQLGLDTEQRLPEEPRDLAFKHTKSLAYLWHSPFPPQDSITYLYCACMSLSVSMCRGRLDYYSLRPQALMHCGSK